MKKLIQTTIIFSLMGTLFITGCKKGEDDPFISLHSRKARVTGEWKLTSGVMNEKNYDDLTQTTSTLNTTYDGANASETQTVSNGSGTTTTTNSYSYTTTFNFKKDGTFTSTVVEDGITTSSEGTWNFGAGVGDVKKKSELVLFYTKVVYDGTPYTYSGNAQTEVYYLKELRNDKMVMQMEINYTDGNGDTSEGLLELVFGQ